MLHFTVGFWCYHTSEAQLVVLLPLHYHLLRYHCRLLLHAILHLMDNERHENHNPLNRHLAELAYTYITKPSASKSISVLLVIDFQTIRNIRALDVDKPTIQSRSGLRGTRVKEVGLIGRNTRLTSASGTEQIQKHDVRCERGANANLSYLYD